MTQNNPFADYTKAFEAFKSFQPKFPAVDFSKISAAGQKNFEAITQANKALAEGIQAVAKRQVEIAQANAEEALNLMKDIAASKDPKESAAKQADFAKASMEKAANDAREIAELAAKSNNKIIEMLGKQVNENMKEFGDLTKEVAKKAA